MDVSFQRRLAAEVLGVGVHRVWVDPNHIKEVAQAMTKDDIRELIKKGYIKALPEEGTSRHRARHRHEQRKKGRQRGHGSRKGKKTARNDPKREWINRIRALRKLLRILRDKGIIDRKLYRKAYRLAKGGFFRSKRHLLMWLKEQGVEKIHVPQ